ncbi:MAG: glycosyltransferase family 1 protein [Candidatus Woykebacteria bacterium]
MNIGIDASRIATEERSGTENYTLQLLKAILDKDKKNRYTLYFNKLPLFFEVTQENVSTRYIPLTYLWTQGRLSVECLLKPPDILFVPAHTIPVIRRPSMKTIVTIHDLGAEFLEAYHKFPQKIYLNWSTEYVGRSASHIIAVSESTKKDLTNTLRVPEKRVSVVYEGVDHSFFYKRDTKEIENVRLKYGLKNKYLLFVGTIQPRKNLVRLIEAFAKLSPTKTDLVLVGRPGWLYDEIYKAPKRFGVSERVKFMGFASQDDLPALYSGSEALVFPSLYEGFGLPIVEAMACEAPVITSRSSSMPEVSGGNALLIDPADVTDIAHNMIRILREEDLRYRLAAKGSEWSKKFSWEKAAEETIKVFEKVYNEE